jgi:hypothetical protein
MGRLSSTDLVIGDPKTSIILDLSTRISGHGHQTHALAFPNPSPGIFNVSVPERMVGSYSVYDISGRIVQTRTITPASSVIVDLGNEANGTYFLELITTEGLRSMVKVQVRH